MPIGNGYQAESTNAQSPSGRGKTELEVEVKHFLIALRQMGRTPETLEKYGLRLDRLTTWLAEHNVTRLNDISRVLLREWGAELHELERWTGLKVRSKDAQTLAPATIRHIIADVRSFLTWCYKEDLLDIDLAGALQPPKAKARMQRTLDTDEIQALINSCDANTLKGLRDLALISLMTDSGLRSSEVRNLTVQDVHFEVTYGPTVVNMIEVIGKGGNQEPVFFGKTTAERLKAWLRVRTNAPDVEEVFISVGGSTPGMPFTRDGLRIMLTKLGNKADIAGVTPHALRRSFACIADEAGASTRKIQAWGRWSDINMVERYTQALKAGKQYNQYSPMDYISSLPDQS